MTAKYAGCQRELGAHPLTILVIIFSRLISLNFSLKLGLPNVVTVFMGYLRPQTFEADYGKIEFLRKPIKESTFVACLREVWSTFDANSKPRLLRPSSRSQLTLAQLSPAQLSPKTSSSKAPPQLGSKSPPPLVYPLNILVVEGTNFFFLLSTFLLLSQ